MPLLIGSSSSPSPLLLPPSGCPLLQLPNEMIDTIHRHLTPCSSQALALTCRQLLRALSASHSSSGPFIWLGKELDTPGLRDARRDFLLLMQSEFPNHWYCAKEDKLVLGRPLTKPFSQTPRCKCDPASVSDRLEIKHPGELQLHWGDIRLALNRHFSGAPYGLALDYFTCKRAITASSSMNTNPKYNYPMVASREHDMMAQDNRTVTWSEQWSARIIRDEFYLHAERALNWKGADEQELLRYLRDHNYWICGHLRVGSGTLLEALGGKFENHPRFRGCNRCLTDFSPSITHRTTGDGEPFLRVVLETYHYFGNSSSRRLDENNWSSAMPIQTDKLASECWPLGECETFAVRRKMGFEAGHVRMEWDSGELDESGLAEMLPRVGIW